MKATIWGLIKNGKELVIEGKLITYNFGFYKKFYMVEAMDDLVLEARGIYLRWILVKVNGEMNVELTKDLALEESGNNYSCFTKSKSID